ncbi:MAG: hypothetical protein Q8S17_08425 [Humidesulfovibrio sp.]|nr:hypothetical protein [Humidesulfovibrio sp.]
MGYRKGIQGSEEPLGWSKPARDSALIGAYSTVLFTKIGPFVDALRIGRAREEEPRPRPPDAALEEEVRPRWRGNVDNLVTTARLLGELTDEVVFVGGAATGLLLTDPAAPDVRPTLDLDDFLDGLPGFLHPDPGSQARVPVILDRMKSIASVAPQR